MGEVVLRHVFFILFIVLFSLGTAHAERRVALVIGNSDYDNVSLLQNPRNDANGMSERLQDLGFDVTLGVDLKLGDLRRTIHRFVRKLEGADLALFFYAGHGLQVNGQNYLVPTDAQLESHLDLDFETVSTNLVMNAMEKSAKVNLVFLDACRDNPLAENLARSMGTRSGAIGKGLAKIGSGVGTLISFATQPGNVALDGNGRNSPFTAALLKHLGTPGFDITRELILVRRDVLAATGGQQVPWENSSLTGEVVLKQKEVVAPVVPRIDPQIELTYWNSIKDGSSVAYFETYLNRYPSGQFADIAQIRIEEINAGLANAETERKQQKASAEIAYWQSIQTAREPEMFESYLARYPEGLYADLAKLKISSLRKQAADAAKSETIDVTLKSEPSLEQQVATLTPEKPRSDPTRETATPKELARAIQTELNRLGCSVGRVDGDWGRRSRSALKSYYREAGSDLASLDPEPAVLDQLRKSSGRVCPLTCGRNQKLENGSCVALKQKLPFNETEKKNKTKSASSARSCPADPTARLLQFNTSGGTRILTHPCGRSAICRFGSPTGRDTQPIRCYWK
ncbi:caspase domain-containing protein [Roseibium sp. AS2]|uniref:caspase domain-containing protein n=1 Tax=Roseibium sp. AS2 TaxID=3135781 RepID=UPI0031799B98